MTKQVRYLVFDVESVADAELVAKLKYPDQEISPKDAVRAYRDELLEANDTDFIPYSYQLPISIVIAKIAADFSVIDIVSLDEPNFRPHIMTDLFWRGWQAYNHPTLVTFNGRGFDIPLLELAAFRYGLSIPAWFALKNRTYDQPRNRYNLDSHFDLCDVLTNFGATRLIGGLNLLANLIGKPGKMDVQGKMVQDLYDQGEIERINNYCRCDVLDTYFVFLRTAVLTGLITIEQEQSLVLETKQWLEQNSKQVSAYGMYLENWGDWRSPWKET
ncbi:MAG: 3'-5' exonuclease [Planctomycetaceae bacterium]|jgi:predicted PolB exonuclease-like 3'-5' exonuclease|nr:3'-5' exonuclease [Planctomycetaceae bacterium]